MCTRSIRRLRISCVAAMLLAISIPSAVRADAMATLRLKFGATPAQVSQSGYNTVRPFDWAAPREKAAFEAYLRPLTGMFRAGALAEHRCALEALRVDFPGAPTSWRMNLDQSMLRPGDALDRARADISIGRKPDPKKFDRLFLSLWASNDRAEGRVLCLGFLVPQSGRDTDGRLIFAALPTEFNRPVDLDRLRATVRRDLGLGINPVGLAAQARVWKDDRAGILVEDRIVYRMLVWSDRAGRQALVMALADAWQR